MRGNVTQQNRAEQELNLDLACMRRNPYLIDYQEQKRAREHRERTHKANAYGRDERQSKEQQRKEQQRKAQQRKEQQRKEQMRRDRYRVTAGKRARIRRQKTLALLAGAVCILCFSGLLLFWVFDKPDVDGSTATWFEEMGMSARNDSEELVQGIKASAYGKHPKWTEDFLPPNEYSRPGDALKEVKNIFVHYTANKGTSAAQNRSYFEQLKDTHERSASAHFIIGYEGEIIQCVPLDEIAYAVQTRNEDSLSIECCYLAEDGSFTQETYDSLVTLLHWLVETYDLDTEDILRHYDCGGKKCPIYYTEHEDAWERLKKDVKTL